MRLVELMNKIGHNNALHNATQYNIVLFAPLITVKLDEFSDKADEESIHIIREFLSSLLPQEKTEAKSQKDPGSPKPTELRSPGSLQSGCFEMLAAFRKDRLESIGDYSLFGSQAIEALEWEHLKSISTWLATPESTILLIDVINERPGPSWTTDFVLEMADVLKTANFGTLVTHLCRKESSENYGEEGVLQDILAHIIESDLERLTEEKLCSTDYRSEKLWEIIVKCLKSSRIRVLVIMLDRIEEIFLQGLNNNPDRFQKFVNDLNHYTRTLHTDHGVIVKTMVTCRLKEAALYFYEAKASYISICNPSRRRFRN